MATEEPVGSQHSERLHNPVGPGLSPGRRKETCTCPGVNGFRGMCRGQAHFTEVSRGSEQSHGFGVRTPESYLLVTGQTAQITIMLTLCQAVLCAFNHLHLIITTTSLLSPL